MTLWKELNKKDRSLKSQLLITSPEEKKQNPSQCVFSENGFLGDVSSDFNIHKKDFPENTLAYINQGSLTTYKSERLIYTDYVIIG